MKRCGYCGHDNTDEAAVCCECGTTFAALNASSDGAGWREPAPASRSKLIFIFTAWLLTLLALLPFAATPFVGPLIIIALPSGLWGVFTEKQPNSWNIVVGWVFYAVVVTVLMRAKRRPLFVCLYVILVLALILNVSGCYKIADAVGRDLH